MPSKKIRVVAIWLWLNGLYYLFNAVVITSVILILVSLETAVGGSKFVMLQDNYPLILIPLGYAFLSYFYQHNAFKILSLTRRSFYMACFLIMGHFIFLVSTILALNYLLSSFSSKGTIPDFVTILISLNPLILVPIICIILLAISNKEFENQEKKLSNKAIILIFLFSILPIFISVFLIIWGTTEVLDTDYNYAKVQNQTDFVIYKPDKLQTGMHYGYKFNYKAEDDSVVFAIAPNIMDGRMIVVSQYSTIKTGSASIVSNIKNTCKEESRVCNFPEVNVSKSKTGKAYYFEGMDPKEYEIIYDTIDGTTVSASFVSYSTSESYTFLDQLK